MVGVWEGLNLGSIPNDHMPSQKDPKISIERRCSTILPYLVPQTRSKPHQHFSRRKHFMALEQLSKCGCKWLQISSHLGFEI